MSEVVAREFVDRSPDLGYECEEDEAIGSWGTLHFLESVSSARSTIEQQVHIQLITRL